jgi:hypothetical protein
MSFDYTNSKTWKSKKYGNNNIGGLYDVLILIQQKTNEFILYGLDLDEDQWELVKFFLLIVIIRNTWKYGKNSICGLYNALILVQ